MWSCEVVHTASAVCCKSVLAQLLGNKIAIKSLPGTDTLHQRLPEVSTFYIYVRTLYTLQVPARKTISRFRHTDTHTHSHTCTHTCTWRHVGICTYTYQWVPTYIRMYTNAVTNKCTLYVLCVGQIKQLQMKNNQTLHFQLTKAGRF